MPGSSRISLQARGSQQHYQTLSHMGTALANWFGMDLVSLLFKTTPGCSRVQLGLRTTAVNAYNLTTIGTTQTTLRELEDLMIRLWPGAERKRTTDGPGETAPKKGNLTQGNCRQSTWFLYSKSRSMLSCTLKTNKHLLFTFPSIFIEVFKMHICILLITKNIHILCRKTGNHC